MTRELPMPAPAPVTAADAAAPSRGRQWFAFLGGAIAWTLHLIGAWAIAEFGCVSGLASVLWMGLSAVAWMLIALTAFTLIVAIAAAGLGYRDHRRLAATGSAAEDGGQYLARAGWMISALFALIIAFESIPIFFYLQHC